MKFNKNIKKVLQTYSNRFYYFLLIDTIFLLTLFFFLIYSRSKIQGYIDLIQQYSPELINLQNLLEGSTELSNLLQLEDLLNLINGLTNKALFFGYFIVPLVILLIWCFFQSMNFNLIHNNKFFNLKYFLKFLLLTLPAYFSLIFLIINLLNLFGGVYFKETSYSNLSIILSSVLFIILSYLTLIAYSLNKLKKAFLLGFKKFYILFPLYLGFLALNLFLIFLIFNLYVNYIADSFNLTIVNIIIILILLVAIGYYRFFFTFFLERY